MVSAVTSTRVSTTLNFTDSPTPRRLISASSTMNPSAIRVIVPVPGVLSIQPLASNPPVRFWARTLAEVEALVMPEQITAKATMKVMKCTPNALCV